MNQETTGPKQTQTVQEELTQDELDNVTGGGIRVPDKTPKGFKGEMQSLNFSKPGQEKSFIIIF